MIHSHIDISEMIHSHVDISEMIHSHVDTYMIISMPLTTYSHECALITLMMKTNCYIRVGK